MKIENKQSKELKYFYVIYSVGIVAPNLQTLEFKAKSFRKAEKKANKTLNRLYPDTHEILEIMQLKA